MIQFLRSVDTEELGHLRALLLMTWISLCFRYAVAASTPSSTLLAGATTLDLYI